MGFMAIVTVGSRRAKDQEWAQIELPAPAKVSKIVFSRDREGQYQDRMPLGLEVRLSLDGKTWKTAAVVKAANFAVRHGPGGYVAPVPLPDPATWDGLVRYAFLCERKTWQRISPADHISPLRVERAAVPGGPPYWGRIARLDPLARTLVLMEEMLGRLAAKGLDVKEERSQWIALRRRQAALAAKARSRRRRGGVALSRRPHGQAKADVPRPGPGRPCNGSSSSSGIPISPRTTIATSSIRSSGRAAGSASWKSRAWRAAWNPARRSSSRSSTQASASPAIPMADFDAKRVYFAYRPEPESDARPGLLLAPDVGRRGRGQGPRVDPRAVPRLSIPARWPTAGWPSSRPAAAPASSAGVRRPSCSSAWMPTARTSGRSRSPT